MWINRAQLATLASLLLVSLAVVIPLAYASPGDQSWIPGVYDAADYDDVVLLIISALDTVLPLGKADLRTPGQTASLAPPFADGIVARVTLLPQPRAPPALVH